MGLMADVLGTSMLFLLEQFFLIFYNMHKFYSFLEFSALILLCKYNAVIKKKIYQAIFEGKRYSLMVLQLAADNTKNLSVQGFNKYHRRPTVCFPIHSNDFLKTVKTVLDLNQ